MTSSDKPWSARLAPYRRADNRRAVVEIAITVIPFVILWSIILTLIQTGTLLSIFGAVALQVLAGGLMVRLFIIQHDCGHGSLFSSRKVNDWVGRVLGAVTLTPYAYWRHMHAVHHAGSGNLDRRGMGDIDTLTINEYRQKGFWGRLCYRLYRHPVVMFGIGPAYLFLFRHRIPIGLMDKGRWPWISALATNVGVAMVFAFIIILAGWKAFLLVHIPIVVLGASIGVWMFYVQHQFDPTHWDRDADWSHEHSALHGSSYYDLPKPLMWLTGNIGIHHVHHLSSRIPFHRLPSVVKEFPELASTGRLGFLESLRCVKLSLWDEQRRQLVSFRELRAA